MDCTQVLDDSDCENSTSANDIYLTAFLVINGEKSKIFNKENVIGRDNICNVQIGSQTVSGRHAVIEVDGIDSHVIYDLGSTNKTKLGKMTLKPHVRYHIRDGETLMFGNIKATYEYVLKEDSSYIKYEEVKDKIIHPIIIPESPEKPSILVGIIPETPVKDPFVAELATETSNDLFQDQVTPQKNMNMYETATSPIAVSNLTCANDFDETIYDLPTQTFDEETNTILTNDQIKEDVSKDVSEPLDTKSGKTYISAESSCDSTAHELFQETIIEEENKKICDENEGKHGKTFDVCLEKDFSIKQLAGIKNDPHSGNFIQDEGNFEKSEIVLEGGLGATVTELNSEDSQKSVRFENNMNLSEMLTQNFLETTNKGPSKEISNSSNATNVFPDCKITKKDKSYLEWSHNNDLSVSEMLTQPFIKGKEITSDQINSENSTNDAKIPKQLENTECVNSKTNSPIKEIHQYSNVANVASEAAKEGNICFENSQCIKGKETNIHIIDNYTIESSIGSKLSKEQPGPMGDYKNNYFEKQLHCDNFENNLNESTVSNLFTQPFEDTVGASAGNKNGQLSVADFTVSLDKKFLSKDDKIKSFFGSAERSSNRQSLRFQEKGNDTEASISEMFTQPVEKDTKDVCSDICGKSDSSVKNTEHGGDTNLFDGIAQPSFNSIPVKNVNEEGIPDFGCGSVNNDNNVSLSQMCTQPIAETIDINKKLTNKDEAKTTLTELTQNPSDRNNFENKLMLNSIIPITKSTVNNSRTIVNRANEVGLENNVTIYDFGSQPIDYTNVQNGEVSETGKSSMEMSESCTKINSTRKYKTSEEIVVHEKSPSNLNASLDKSSFLSQMYSEFFTKDLIHDNAGSNLGGSFVKESINLLPRVQNISDQNSNLCESNSFEEYSEVLKKKVRSRKLSSDSEDSSELYFMKHSVASHDKAKNNCSVLTTGNNDNDILDPLKNKITVCENKIKALHKEFNSGDRSPSKGFNSSCQKLVPGTKNLEMEVCQISSPTIKSNTNAKDEVTNFPNNDLKDDCFTSINNHDKVPSRDVVWGNYNCENITEEKCKDFSETSLVQASAKASNFQKILSTPVGEVQGQQPVKKSSRQRAHSTNIENEEATQATGDLKINVNLLNVKCNKKKLRSRKITPQKRNTTTKITAISDILNPIDGLQVKHNTPQSEKKFIEELILPEPQKLDGVQIEQNISQESISCKNVTVPKRSESVGEIDVESNTTQEKSCSKRDIKHPASKQVEVLSVKSTSSTKSNESKPSKFVQEEISLDCSKLAPMITSTPIRKSFKQFKKVSLSNVSPGINSNRGTILNMEIKGSDDCENGRSSKKTSIEKQEEVTDHQNHEIYCNNIIEKSEEKTESLNESKDQLITPEKFLGFPQSELKFQAEFNKKCFPGKKMTECDNLTFKTRDIKETMLTEIDGDSVKTPEVSYTSNPKGNVTMLGKPNKKKQSLPSNVEIARIDTFNENKPVETLGRGKRVRSKKCFVNFEENFTEKNCKIISEKKKSVSKFEQQKSVNSKSNLSKTESLLATIPDINNPTKVQATILVANEPVQEKAEAMQQPPFPKLNEIKSRISLKRRVAKKNKDNESNKSQTNEMSLQSSSNELLVINQCNQQEDHFIHNGISDDERHKTIKPGININMDETKLSPITIQNTDNSNQTANIVIAQDIPGQKKLDPIIPVYHTLPSTNSTKLKKKEIDNPSLQTCESNERSNSKQRKKRGKVCDDLQTSGKSPLLLDCNKQVADVSVQKQFQSIHGNVLEGVNQKNAEILLIKCDVDNVMSVAPERKSLRTTKSTKSSLSIGSNEFGQGKMVVEKLSMGEISEKKSLKHKISKQKIDSTPNKFQTSEIQECDKQDCTSGTVVKKNYQSEDEGVFISKRRMNAASLSYTDKSLLRDSVPDVLAGRSIEEVCDSKLSNKSYQTTDESASSLNKSTTTTSDFFHERGASLGRNNKRKSKIDSLSDISSETNESSINRGRKKKRLSPVDVCNTSSGSDRTRRSTPQKLSTCSVMFTGYSDQKMMALIKRLGGSIVENPFTCNVLVTDKVRRTIKFLCSVAKGCPIVSPQWLYACQKSSHFVDPYEHILVDPDAEAKFSFNLKNALSKAKSSQLLDGWAVYVTASVKPPHDEMKSIIELSGGRFLQRVPAKWPQNSFVISTPEDRGKWSALKKNGSTPFIVNNEVLLTGVLQQKLDLNLYQIK